MKITCQTLRRILLILALAIGQLAASTAIAQTVPALVNYQGRLANPDGTALATGDYQLTFRVYDTATNSTGLVWGPQVFDGVGGQGHGGMIPVVQGYFNVLLGPVDTNGVLLADGFNTSNRFVEITVSNHLPILPRQQILSVPFALNSAKLANYDWSAVFGTNDPVNGRIPATKLATNGNILAQSLGLRVNNPTVPLDVLGRIRLRGDNTIGTAGALLFDTITGNDRAFVGMNGSSTVGFYGNAGGIWALNVNVTNGNVGVGTTTPATPLHVLRQSGGISATFEASPGVNTINLLSHNGSGNNGSVLKFTDGTTDSGGIASIASGGLVFSTTGVGRVVIDGSGNVGIGTPGTPVQKLEVNGGIAGVGYACRAGTTGAYGGNVFNFNWTGSAIAAYIDNLPMGNVSLTSDRRLKEHINVMESGAMERVMQLKPVSFKYKKIPDTIFYGSPDIQEGFIADELQEVIPSAVSGERNALTSDGRIQPQTINITPLVSVLTKALQEQQRIIEDQQQQLDALKIRLGEIERANKIASKRN